MNGDLISALHDKVNNLQKMHDHLAYSYRNVQAWWNRDAAFESWSDPQLESLAAFKARFAELQDHLASAMRMIALIEGEDVRMFTYVLNYMEQLGLLASWREWQQMRDLRNAAAHDYSASDAVKAQHFDELLRATPYLMSVFERLRQFVLTHYSGNEK